MTQGNTIQRSKLFDPGTAFFKLPIVWITSFIVLMLAILLAGWITWWSSPLLPSNRHYQGINELVTIFRLPLGLVALLIPILAVYATNHRSEQNLETMRLTRVQNNFSNYYKHLEEFLKYLQQFELLGNFSVKERRLHALLFPDLKRGSLSLNEDFLSKLSERVGGLLELSGQSTAPKTASVLDVPEIRHMKDGRLRNVEQEIEAIEALYSAVMRPLPHDSIWIWIDHDSDFDLVRTYYSDRLINIYRCLSFINHAVSFDAEFFSPLDALLEKFDRHITYTG